MSVDNDNYRSKNLEKVEIKEVINQVKKQVEKDEPIFVSTKEKDSLNSEMANSNGSLGLLTSSENKVIKDNK